MTVSVTATELATRIHEVIDGALLAFDVDGVLAPIVEHADEPALLPGVGEALARLSATAPVAILSGRSLDSLERRFGFADGLHVIGSHGLEHRGAAALELDHAEQDRFDALEAIARRAVEATGEGAWLECKPASVVVHTRGADPDRAAHALARARHEVDGVEGATSKDGHEVLELLARAASKGGALTELAERLERSPVLYVGDDPTDEEAFAQLGDDDFTVRVGNGDTLARFRLPDPHAVRELVDLLVRL
jgi:trehalose 6-phosphate phosphatase